jgi:hypothetical protein
MPIRKNIKGGVGHLSAVPAHLLAQSAPAWGINPMVGAAAATALTVPVIGALLYKKYKRRGAGRKKLGGLVVNPATIMAAQKATQLLHGLISGALVYGGVKLATKKKKKKKIN